MELLLGNCLDRLKDLEDNSVDAIVTDPPYGLSFMGKKWDYDVPSVDIWKECLRVLKPGGYLLSFAGTRTQHRMAVNIEDAGFEIRDMIMYVYGSGFPKSLNIFKQLKKRCTCGNMEAYEQDRNVQWVSNKQEAEYSMRPVSETNISETINLKEEQGEVLQQSLSEQSLSTPLLQLPSKVRKGQPSLEGGGNLQESKGELQGSDIPEVSKGVSTNGEEGRIYNATQTGDGSTSEQTIGESGGSSSPRPQSQQQQYREPCAFCKQYGTQAMGALGLGSALKPACEPITVARKPISEKNLADNHLKWGVGGINIDGSRVPTSYNSDDKVSDNTLDTFPSQKLYELRGKLYTLLLSSVADKKDCQSLSSVDGYVQSWKVLQDCLGDCSACLRLYDVLSPLFLGGDQVPVQQLHDVHDDISRLQQEQSDNPSGQDTDHLSSLGDFSQLVLTYLNDTTPNVKSKAPVGRFPANLIHDGSDEVVGLFPQTKSGGSGKLGTFRKAESPIEFTSKRYVTEKEYREPFEGNASRFFYCAKASKKERNIGCEGLEEKVSGLPLLIQREWSKIERDRITTVLSKYITNTDKDCADKFNVSPALVRFWKRGERTPTQETLKLLKVEYHFGDLIDDILELDLITKTERTTILDKANKPLAKNNHPTVKPIALMEYLVKLVSREGQVILDPFMGSGTTGMACKKLDREFVGIEMMPEYMEIAKCRIEGTKKEEQLNMI